MSRPLCIKHRLCDMSTITGSGRQLALQMLDGREMILFSYFSLTSQILTHAVINRAGDNFFEASMSVSFPSGPLPPARPISGKSSSAALGCEREVCCRRRAGLQGLILQQEADLQPWTGTIYQHSAACRQADETELPWAKVATENVN